MYPATFQSAVIATVTTIMAQLSTNNINGNRNGVNSSNHGNSQEHQGVCSYKDASNDKPKNSHDNGGVLSKKQKR